MNKAFLALMVGLVVLSAGCGKQQSAPRNVAPQTFSSFDPPTTGEKLLSAGTLNLAEADLTQVLNLYAEISGRSVLRGENLPEVKITFSNPTPMNTVRALQALDSALATKGIVAIIQGTQFVKMVSRKEASKEAGPIVDLPPDQLPDSSSFLVYIVKPQKGLGQRGVQALALFSQFENGIMYIPGSNHPRPGPLPAQVGVPQQILDKIEAKDDVLILRDYSSNVKAMLKVLKTLEQ